MLSNRRHHEIDECAFVKWVNKRQVRRAASETAVFVKLSARLHPDIVTVGVPWRAPFSRHWLLCNYLIMNDSCCDGFVVLYFTDELAKGKSCHLVYGLGCGGAQLWPIPFSSAGALGKAPTVAYELELDFENAAV